MMKKKISERNPNALKTGFLITVMLLLVILQAKTGSPSMRTKKSRPDSVKKTEETRQASQPFGLDDDWRWAYRKEVVSRLRQDALKSDDLEKEVVKSALGLSSSDREYIIREAGFLIASLKAGGQKRKADEFKKIIAFYEGDKNKRELIDISTDDPGSEASFAAQFLVGVYYAKNGFFPEASGYFNKVSRESKDGFIKAAAIYKEGQLMFFENRFSDAVSTFEKAVRAGSIEARLWLANALLLRGETEKAWKIYEKNSTDRNISDPITLMSIGDISAIKGDFSTARNIFNRLAANFKKSKFIAAFFTLKSGDTYLSEGRRDEAIRIYRNTKASLSGEGWSMATLSLADALAASSGAKSQTEALGMYQAVSEGDYLGSGYASLSAVSLEIKLDKFDEAVSNLASFPGRFPASPLRTGLNSLYGELAYRWINSLFSHGDYYGVVKLYSVYGARIPFGKKATTYLETGKAYAKLGLLPEAVDSLSASVKMGNNAVSEEAMIELVAVYVSQGDANAAERLLRIYKSRFPKSSRSSEAEKLHFDIAYIKKDYKEIADSRTASDDPRSLMMKAHALLKLGRKKEAVVFLGKAANKFREEGDMREAAAAFIDIADTAYAAEDYGEAISGYRKAVESLKDGKYKDDDDRSWSLYRIAQSYERLDMKDERNEALKDLDGLNNDYGRWSKEIFRETHQRL